MKVKDFIGREPDLILTTAIFILILFLKFYLKIDYAKTLNPDVFLQVYIAIIAVVLTVFAIITTFNEKLFVNIIKKRLYGIFKRSFYTPFIVSVIGVIYTILITFYISEWTMEIVYLINLGILIYAVLSSLILFNFIFKLTFELKKELYKNR